MLRRPHEKHQIDLATALGVDVPDVTKPDEPRRCGAAG